MAKRKKIDWTPPAAPEHPNSALVPEGARPCPVCGESMRSAKMHDVVMDVCEGHGIWLDEGELASIVQRVESRRMRQSAMNARRRRERKEVATTSAALLAFCLMNG